MYGVPFTAEPKGVTNRYSPASDFSQAQLLDLWHRFADIPINDDDLIEAPFLHFPAGTYRFDVWHWFDERWPGGVYELLFL